MKTVLSALALMCAALGPEAWTFIPQFRADVLRAVAWLRAPLLFCGVICALILLDLYLVGREDKRK